MKGFLKNKDGFTLIEVLIAVAILTVGILATAVMFDTSYRGTGSAKALNAANRIAEQKIEEMATRGHQAVLNSMPAGNYTVSGSTKTNWQDQTVSNITYRITIRIDEGYVITGSVTVDKALVTVSWTERNVSRQVQYETYL